tara:strand:- start:16552 stop:20232 length:3681 start_codon:yes stop_codon:yes gene_type:complete
MLLVGAAFIAMASALAAPVVASTATGTCAQQPGQAVLRCSLESPVKAAALPEAQSGVQLALELALGSDTDSHVLLDAIEAVQQRYSEGVVDWKQGIRLTGEGAGAARAIELSAELPDNWWRGVVKIVDAREPSGRYSAAFSRAAMSGAVAHVYYRVDGATGPGASGLDTGFFRLCESYRIACFGTWHQAGSGGREAGINLPRGRFSDSAQAVRHGLPLPVFTASSANAWGERGHYNLGLGWHAQGIIADDKQLVVPLRYQRHTGLSDNPNAPLADQPEQVSFTLTLRGSKLLKMRRGERVQWVLDGSEQRGTVTVDSDGSATIEDIRLASGEAFQALRVTPAKQHWQLVYTRQPRASKPVPGTPVKEAANWQHATDVGRINHGLAEADVVIDDLSGKVKVIHNCTTSSEICVAHEARVSPDGTKIVYSVGYGNELTPVVTEGVRLGLREIPGLTHAELWIYDLTTGKKWPIPRHPAQAIDRQPDWLNNDQIVFVSNRAGLYPFKNPFGMHQGQDQFGRGRCFNAPYCVSQEYGYGSAGRAMQLWTMNIDGSDARNISPHEQNALAPAVMSNGDILYSCWNAHENKNFDTWTAHSNKPQTSKNKWWLCRVDGNGADQTVILNGHKTTTVKTREWLPRGMQGGEMRSILRAIRSVAEIFPGKLAVSNYYRSNHVGSMGIVYAIDYKDPHVEGCSTARCYPDGESSSGKPGSGRYVPSSLRAITPYGTDQDMAVRRDSRGRALGKAGYAAPLPNTDSEFLLTHGRGSCYEATPLHEANRRAMGGEPTCQKAIYRVKVDMVTDPFDTRQMELLAGGEAWQAWDARAIAPYRELMGQELPAQPAPLDSDANCYLQVVDARAAELQPGAERFNWRTNFFEHCTFQGCAVSAENPRFHRENMHALSIFLPEMWDITYRGSDEAEYASILNNTGHKSVALLGSQPLETDGSVKMQVPCETPLLMAGTDADGMAIAHDAMLHSLRAGETRTCHGCHDGHSEERAGRLKQPAVERFATTLAANTYPPMPVAQSPVTFADVQPILEKRCASCHKDMNNRDGLLYSRLAQDFEQHDWPWARKQPGIGQRRSVEHVLIKNGGRGYAKGEQLVFPAGGAAGQISKVGKNGRILDIRLERGGDGYEPLTTVRVNSAAGKGAHLVAMTDYFDLPRPYSSKWVAKFARDSLLYWKCVGERTDGRTDGQYPNDIDFGPAHDSGATAEECRVIGRWIDTGIQHVK